jgi:hypothetical protein
MKSSDQRVLPKYHISFTVSSRDPPYPCDKIMSSPNYEVDCSGGVIKTITIKNISADDVQSAVQMAGSQFRAVMGFIALKTGRILEHNGGRIISIIDDRGNVTKAASSKSDTSQDRVFDPPVSVDLIGFAVSRARDTKTEYAFNLYHLASSLKNDQNISIAFLNLFLSLETLIAGKGLSSDQLKYRYIRYSIVYGTMGDKDTRSFLLNEFGSHSPNWQTSEMQARLVKWYNLLEHEVVQLLNSKLT